MKKTPADPRKKRQNVSLDVEVAEMLQALAKARHTSMSQLITDMIIEKSAVMQTASPPRQAAGLSEKQPPSISPHPERCVKPLFLPRKNESQKRP